MLGWQRRACLQAVQSAVPVLSDEQLRVLPNPPSAASWTGGGRGCLKLRSGATSCRSAAALQRRQEYYCTARSDVTELLLLLRCRAGGRGGAPLASLAPSACPVRLLSPTLQLAAGLQYLHQNRVLHRDMKPEVSCLD